MAALMWISHAKRPLKADELCHARVVEIELPNLDADNIPSIGLLLACCQRLVSVDREGSTVRLIHFTVQEYLRARPELFHSAHSTIAETCLSYLTPQQVKALPIWPSPDLKDTSFLEYSSLYWGMHAKRELSDGAKLLALKLFDDYNNHISTDILLEAHKVYRYHGYLNYHSLFSGLHCDSLLGTVEIVADLLEVEGCDINQEDFAGTAPLLWAARNGHDGVVEIILGWGDISPDKQDNFGRTPLRYASEYSYAGVVSILLGRDEVNPDKLDMSGLTQL